MNDMSSEKTLSTADFAAVVEKPNTPPEVMPNSSQANGSRNLSGSDDEGILAPLFLTDAAADFRARRDAVQIGFVDDPRQAVRKADELVAQVMKSLAVSFSTVLLDQPPANAVAPAAKVNGKGKAAMPVGPAGKGIKGGVKGAMRGAFVTLTSKSVELTVLAK